MIKLIHRLATTADVNNIKQLMEASIIENMKAFLTDEKIKAARESMGIDMTLIEDQTYFVIETIKDNQIVIIGCGGWGKRQTLYGGDHAVGRNDSFSDPSEDAARIRAMYTHPSWTRCGVGSLLLELGETAARDAGYSVIELGSTIPGEPLYRARGYKEYGRDIHETTNGTKDIIIKMAKKLL